jgi:hypothetical protein
MDMPKKTLLITNQSRRPPHSPLSSREYASSSLSPFSHQRRRPPLFPLCRRQASALPCLQAAAARSAPTLPPHDCRNDRSLARRRGPHRVVPAGARSQRTRGTRLHRPRLIGGIHSAGFLRVLERRTVPYTGSPPLAVRDWWDA